MPEQRIDFGKRRPLPPPPATPPVKRSGHVALLLMGTLAVGSTAYALMPHQQSCPPQGPDAPAVTGQPQTGECGTRRSGGSGGGGSGSGRWGFSSGDSEARAGSSTHVADASSAHVSRGGFGSFAHGFGFGGGG
jgi:hypothetical protein